MNGVAQEGERGGQYIRGSYARTTTQVSGPQPQQQQRSHSDAQPSLSHDAALQAKPQTFKSFGHVIERQGQHHQQQQQGRQFAIPVNSGGGNRAVFREHGQERLQPQLYQTRAQQDLKQHQQVTTAFDVEGQQRSFRPNTEPYSADRDVTQPLAPADVLDTHSVEYVYPVSSAEAAKKNAALEGPIFATLDQEHYQPKQMDPFIWQSEDELGMDQASHIPQKQLGSVHPQNKEKARNNEPQANTAYPTGTESVLSVLNILTTKIMTSGQQMTKSEFEHERRRHELEQRLNTAESLLKKIEHEKAIAKDDERTLLAQLQNQISSLLSSSSQISSVVQRLPAALEAVQTNAQQSNEGIKKTDELLGDTKFGLNAIVESISALTQSFLSSRSDAETQSQEATEAAKLSVSQVEQLNTKLVAAELAKQHNEKELACCRERLAKVEKEAHDKSAILLTLESNNVECDKALLSMRKDKEMVDRELQTAYKHHQDRFESVEKQHAMLLHGKEKEIEVRDRSIAELKVKHKEYIAASTIIKAEKEQLSRALAEKDTQNDMLQNQVDNLSSQIQTYQTELAGIKSEHKLAVRDVVQEHQTEMKALKQRLQDEEANANFLRSQNEALQHNATLAIDSNSRLTKHNENLLSVNSKMIDIISKYSPDVAREELASQTAAIAASAQAASKRPAQRRKNTKGNGDKTGEESDDERGPSTSKRPRLDTLRTEIEVDEDAPLLEDIMDVQHAVSSKTRRTTAADRTRANAAKKGKDDDQSREDGEIVD